MTPINKRRIVSMLIDYAAFAVLAFVGGAGYWAFLVFPFGIWCYYDGMTRQELR